MKKNYRRIFTVIVMLVLCLSMVVPASASSLKTGSCGIAIVMSASGDISQMAVATYASDADGIYVYTGVRSIQDQIILYTTTTPTNKTNNTYLLEEDNSYRTDNGVYRFKLSTQIQTGTRAEAYPEIKSVKAKENVLFVYLSDSDNKLYEERRTKVSSVSGGKLKTTDHLEDSIGSSNFCIIFNENNDVVGFCKNGTAITLASKGFELSEMGKDALIGGTIGAVSAGLWAILGKKKKKKKAEIEAQIQQIPQNKTKPVDDNWEVSETMVAEDFDMGSSFKLVCHGGYLNGRVYEIGEEGLTIGRERDNKVRYPEQTPGISRHHVKLFWQNGQLTLVDLGSSNGTYMNKRRIPPETPIQLNEGDVFFLAEKLNGFQIVRQ